MAGAISTIKNSRLGHSSGRAALYELPWYVTIGNPAAGKSSAIINSGLKFPFEDGEGSTLKGIGGTRNCDWFFSTEGILLDTAGRYSVCEEDRGEWLYFLAQLRKNRPHAPINGIIVTANIAELTSNSPEFAISLARSLRQRIQELTEHLQVIAPAYVMFTKTDLIAGFNDFFRDIDWNERDRVWGATLPCDDAEKTGAAARFSMHFDTLISGLHDLCMAQLSRSRDERAPPGLLAFPLEFAAIKPNLHVFISTLFEDNPYQFEPLFRGFYFTSALQQGETTGLSNQHIEKRFALSGGIPLPERVGSRYGFFLHDLFSQVIFADKHLVKQYTNVTRTRLRNAVFFFAFALFGLALGGWTWSHANNLKLIADITASLDQAAKLQENDSSLRARFAALELIQNQIAALERLDDDHPVSIGAGLYQGAQLRTKLLEEYYAGIRSILLSPVQNSLEAYLYDVSAQSSSVRPAPVDAPREPSRSPGPDQGRPDDAYVALKTYLMLGSRDHLETGHLSEHVTRIWREWLEANRGNMTREEMIRGAERILSFHLARLDDPAWPLIDNNPVLAEDVRRHLREVVQGLPAVDRLYAEIKTRASVRFPALSVNSLLGSDNKTLITAGQLVPGAFTREAWDGYIERAFADAASGEVLSTDWVLQSTHRNDLTLHGSPEQIRQALWTRYSDDYISAWKQFIRSTNIRAFDSVTDAASAIELISNDQHSPLARLLNVIAAQTDWRRPVTPEAQTQKSTAGGIGEWIERTLMRRSGASDSTTIKTPDNASAPTQGPSFPAFAGIGALLTSTDGDAPPLSRYLKELAGLHGRMKQLVHQGDAGPGALTLVRATLEGGNSEFNASLRFIDEQLLAGMHDTQRELIRPLLVRPLQQTFQATLIPAEVELNKIWDAQIHTPFNHRLGVKYPFLPTADIEATAAEIAQIFGPSGAIARYVDESMTGLVVRRGNTVAPRTWGDQGIRLHPAFVAGFPRWVSALDGASAPEDENTPQTTFMLMPHPAPDTTGYTIEIDGQRLSYRNGASQWATFVWPNAGAIPGARIVATRSDGSTAQIADFAGRFGLEKLINSAVRIRNSDGSFTLSWSGDGLNVSLGLRIISSTQAQASEAGTGRQGLGGTLPARIAGDNERDAIQDAAHNGPVNTNEVSS